MWDCFFLLFVFICLFSSIILNFFGGQWVLATQKGGILRGEEGVGRGNGISQWMDLQDLWEVGWGNQKGGVWVLLGRQGGVDLC